MRVWPRERDAAACVAGCEKVMAATVPNCEVARNKESIPVEIIFFIGFSLANLLSVNALTSLGKVAQY